MRIKENKLTKNEYFDAWKTVIPNKANCECCNKEVYLGKGLQADSIHFDHRNGGNEAITYSPASFLRNKPLNKKNLAIWESCDFGILCKNCNSRIPTKNRDEWLKNVTNYVQRSNAILHARTSSASFEIREQKV